MMTDENADSGKGTPTKTIEAERKKEKKQEGDGGGEEGGARFGGTYGKGTTEYHLSQITLYVVIALIACKVGVFLFQGAEGAAEFSEMMKGTLPWLSAPAVAYTGGRSIIKSAMVFLEGFKSGSGHGDATGASGTNT